MQVFGWLVLLHTFYEKEEELDKSRWFPWLSESSFF